MKTTLYLARHGETQWNILQRLQGQLDSPLTELGKSQSANIARAVIDNKIAWVFSSNLGRAIKSAEICNTLLNSSIQIDTGLTERNLGELQGKKNSDLSQTVNYLELLHQYTNLTPLGGESAVACGKRIHNTLEKIAIEHKNTNILVIFHGEALRCFYGYIGINSTMNAYDLFANGCITTLNYDHISATFELIPVTIQNAGFSGN